MNKNDFIKNTNSGFVLIELFIAIVLLTLLVTGSLSLLFPAIRSTEIGRQRLQAKWLLWEQEEAVRQVRNEAWSNLIPGSYYAVYNSVANPPTTYQGWQLLAGSGVKNGFTENITLSIPYRVNANQVSDTQTGGLVQDTNMRKVVCTISWTSFGTNYSEAVSTYISNWQPF